MAGQRGAHWGEPAIPRWDDGQGWSGASGAPPRGQRAARARTTTMLRYEARSSADPVTAWSLMAEPGRWHEWAPQLRGAWGLGEPEVRRGARGAARLLGVVPVPAKVTAVADGHSWTWAVGPVEFDHRVDPDPAGGGGSLVGVDIRASPALEALLRVTYGPVVALLVKNLARVAGQRALTP
jgi:hypothetical protein